MTDAPEPSVAVERRIVSVLFADLVGFTPLSERLDAEDVAAIQDAYFAAVRETIGRYGGVLEKFIGDAAMAVFGVPAGRDDDAERAVRAGLALIGAVEQLGARMGLEPGELQLRVGVNSGEVVHAVSGPDAGRVTGDTVNTAARLQAAAGPGSVLIGELTALATAEAIETRAVAPVELKGKAQPVRAAEAVAPRAHPSREEALGGLRAPMLGRDAELARLRDALERVATDRSAHRMLVVAPPGVGKSRLLAELGATVVGEATVLRGRVRPQATAPFETVAQLIAATGRRDELAAALAEAGVSGSRAMVVEDEVARLLDGATHQDLAAADLGAEREARFDAWLTALDALAPGPECWLVEDVHWAGGDLLAFLDAAGRAPTRHGRLLVATARPSLLEAAPAWTDLGARLDLVPLPAAEAEALVAALVGVELPRELVDAIVDRSDGTPLFIEELLRTWASVGTLVRDGDAWRLAVDPDAVTLPATVQAIYAAQLDDLPADARLVARRGSVAGRRVPVDALDALHARSDEGLLRLRRRALLAGPVHDPVIGEAYAYRHALLRDAGYASLARAERAGLHVAMAGWLVAVAGERADVVAEAVAEHYALALESRPALATGGLPAPDELATQAAAWYERAAETAVRLAAHEAGVRLLQRSIDHTDPASNLDLARRRRRLGEVLAASADLDAAIAQLEASLATGGNDPSSLSASAYSLGRAYMQQIRFDEAERLTADALGRLADAPERFRAQLHALHAWSVSAQGRSDGVLEEVAAARGIADRTADALVGLAVLDHTSAARDEVGAATEEDWAELERRARELGAWHHAVAAARVRAVYRAMVDPVGALPVLAEVAELARAHGQLEQAGWCDYTRGEVLWVLGHWDDALDLGTAVVDQAERNAYERLAFRTYVVLLPMAAPRRDATLAARYDAWLEMAGTHRPTVPSPYARILRAAIAIWQAQARGAAPDPPAADLIDAVIPMSNAHFVAAVETLVRAWLDAGATDPAAAAADRVASDAAADDATPLMRASAALIDAWLNRGEPAAAVAAARAASAPWWEARALRAAGDVDAAAEIEARLGVR